MSVRSPFVTDCLPADLFSRPLLRVRCIVCATRCSSIQFRLAFFFFLAFVRAAACHLSSQGGRNTDGAPRIMVVKRSAVDGGVFANLFAQLTRAVRAPPRPPRPAPPPLGSPVPPCTGSPNPSCIPATLVRNFSFVQWRRDFFGDRRVRFAFVIRLFFVTTVSSGFLLGLWCKHASLCLT